MNNTKPARLLAIESLPPELRDHALLDWPTVAAMLDRKDPHYVRKLLIADGVPVVSIGGRRKLPTTKAIREYIARKSA
jgi:hypothetical protein